MSFIRKRNSRKKPSWIHGPSVYVIDTYFWLYLTNIGYWLTRFFNIPLIIIVILLVLFSIWDTNIFSNIVDFIAYAFDVGFVEAFNSFNGISLEDEDIFIILFYIIIFVAFCCVSFWKFIKRKDNSAGLVSLINKKHN